MVTVGELMAKLSEVEDQSMPVLLAGGSDMEVFIAGRTEDYEAAVILATRIPVAVEYDPVTYRLAWSRAATRSAMGDGWKPRANWWDGVLDG